MLNSTFETGLSVVFAVKLASRYICFEYLDCVKRVIFQASDMAKISDMAD